MGQYLALRDNPVNRNGSHKMLWGISYLPSLIKNNTPLAMAAVQVAAKRRYRTHVEIFTVSPELA